MEHGEREAKKQEGKGGMAVERRRERERTSGGAVGSAVISAGRARSELNY